MGNINLFAVLVAAASTFILGGIWYSPILFFKPWVKAAGRPPRMNPLVFIVSLIFALVAATAFAILLGPRPTLDYAVEWGAIVGVCFAATSLGVNYAFAGRGLTLWAIDSGYHVVRFILFGVILGLWH
jgi:hypothetical protein